MSRYDARKELAPRDIVARAIDSELKRRGDDCVYLDMTHLAKAFLLEHFPNIYANCQQFGIDMSVQPIPVVPGTHYTCGGVATDLHGQTTLPRPARDRRGCVHGSARRESAGVELAARGAGVRHRAAALAAEVARGSDPTGSSGSPIGIRARRSRRTRA